MTMSKVHKLFAVAVALGIFAFVSSWQTATARADETSKTTQRTKILKGPGEASPLVSWIPAGTSVTIIGKSGRFVKIRAKGKTGWVPRTALQQTRQARKPVRTARRRPFVDGRSTRRGFGGGAPKDRVGIDATDSTKPTEDGKNDFGDDDDDDDAGDGREAAKPAKSRRVASRGRIRAKGKSKGKRRGKRGDDDDDDFDDFDDDDDDDDDDGRARGDDDDDDDDDDEGGGERSATRVVASTKSRLYERASSRSDRVGSVREGGKLTVLEESRSGKWLRVETEDGDAGWIRKSNVDAAPMAMMGGERAVKRGAAMAGYTALSQTFTSNGQGDLANYKINSAAASLVVGGEYLYLYSPKYYILGDASYTGTRASPGIEFQQNGVVTNIAFLEHALRLGVAGGYNLQNDKGMVVYARVGYHYSKFGINDVANLQVNLARLPSEILQGATAGLWLDVPRYNEKLGFRVGFDAIVFNGKREQTSGLQDGTLQELFAGWGAALVTYQWKPNLTITGGYRGTYATSMWAAEAASQRGNNATASERKDIVHLLSVGLGRQF